jgi:hypothetical protein
VLRVLGAREGAALIRNVALRDHAVASAFFFKRHLGLKCFLGVKACLQLHMDVPTGMVNKDAPAFVLFTGFLLTVGGGESAQRVAVEVIHRHSGTREQVSSLEGARLVLVRDLGNSWKRLAALFCVLTGRA